MACRQCSSKDQRDYLAEVTVHLHGAEDLKKEPVLVFPKVRICSDCGFAEFHVEKQELKQLISHARKADNSR